MEQPPYPMSSLAMILFGLSNMLDSGECDDITLDDVKRHARDGDLIAFLTEKAGGVFASGFLEGREDRGFAKWYVEEIRKNCDVMEAREGRKYGIRRRGICLLISYTAEIIQTGKDLSLKLP